MAGEIVGLMMGLLRMALSYFALHGFEHMKVFFAATLVTLCGFLCGCEPRGAASWNSNENGGRDTQAPSAESDRSLSEFGVSEERLLEVFRSKDFDRVIKTMNDVKRAHYSGHLISVLKALWDGKLGGDFDPNFLNNPRVRLELADALAQIARNGNKNLDKATYANYARGFISSDDFGVSRQAIIVLGVAGDVNDMVSLGKMAETAGANQFRVIVFSLVSNCSTSSALIKILYDKVDEQWRKDLLMSTWEKSKEVRVCP